MNKMNTFFKRFNVPTYLKYILSYLLVFFVFVWGFFYIIRTQLSEKYMEQQSKQVQLQLNNLAEQLNKEILYLNQIADSIKSNSELLSNRYNTPSVFHYKLYQEFRQYEACNEMIHSIVYLTKENNSILSTNLIVKWENESFLITDGNNKTVAFDPSPYYNLSSGRMIFLTNAETQFLIYFPQNYATSDTLFFFILSTNSLTLRFQNLISEETPALALIDSRGQTVVSFNNELLDPCMASLPLKSGIYKQDDTTSLFVLENFTNGFSIVSILSNNFLMEQVNSIFANTYRTFLLICVLGLVFIFVGLRITYLPLHKLIKKNLSSPSMTQSYLTQLDMAFSEIDQQKQLLQEKLFHYRVSIQKFLLDSLLSSNFEFRADTLPKENTYEMPFFNIDQFFDTSSEKRIFVIKTNICSKPSSQLSIFDHFEKAFSGQGNCILLNTNELVQETYLLICNNAEVTATDKIKTLAEELYTKYGIQSAISNSSSSPLDIPSLYANAEWASSFWPQIPIAEYEKLAQNGNTTNHSYAYPHDLLDRLSAALKELNLSTAKEFLSEIFGILDSCTDSENTLPQFFIQCILTDTLTIIVTQINMSNISFKAYSDLYYETLYLCRSSSYNTEADSIFRHMNELITFYEQKMSHKYITPEAIRQFMLEHYCQPDCSITMLAEQFHVSAAYMSILFQNNLRMNFSDYLWMLRLEKAKELLCTTDSSINEISFAVGYINSTSFQRKFKQKTGVTPSQFRENTALS